MDFFNKSLKLIELSTSKKSYPLCAIIKTAHSKRRRKMEKDKLKNAQMQLIKRVGWTDYWEIPIKKRLELIKQYIVKIYGRA